LNIEVKKFTLYCLSTFCVSFGFITSYFFVPIFAKNIGVGMTEIGIIGASYFAVTTFMMYILGKLSDFRGMRDYLIIFGFLGSSAIYFLLSFSNSAIQLLILMMALGLTTSAYQPSLLALVSENKAILTSGKKMGFYNASISAGFGIGIVCGGVISDFFKLSQVFILCGLVVILGFFFVLTVLKIKDPKNKEKNLDDSLKGENQLKDLNLKIIFGSFKNFNKSQIVQTGLIFLCIGIFLRNGGFRGLTTFLPLYLIDLGASNTLMASIISINFILQIFLMPPVGWISDLFGRKITITIGMLGSSIAMLLFSMISDPNEAILIQILVAFCWSMILISANAYVADFIPKGKRGSGMGLIIASQHLGGAVGPAFAGFLTNYYGYRIMLQVLMAFPLIGSIISIMKLKK
jgi:MFS family permease